MRPKITVTLFSCEYLTVKDAPPVSCGPTASEQANTWLAENDVMPVSLTSSLTTAEGCEDQQLSHIICVAWMSRLDWEHQQARITAHALALKERSQDA